MSNGTSLSFVRHSTHGNFANVAIPEKTASAVTRYESNRQTLSRMKRARTDQNCHQDKSPGRGTGHSPGASGLSHGHHVPKRMSRGTARATGEAYT